MSIEPYREKWTGTMTDRERFNRQMHYEAVDRCFNWEFGYWEENFGQWPMFAENGISNNVQARAFLNFDVKKDLVSAWIHPEFEEKVVEDRGDTKIVMNNEGLLAEVAKDGHGTIPHYIKSSITKPDDWKRIKEERFRRDDPVRKVDVAALQREHPADRDYLLIISAGSMIGKVRNLLTFEGLAYAMADYPEMVEDMVETCCVLVEDFLDAVLGQVEIDCAGGWEDICFKSGPIVSVDFFKNVVVPRYQRISKKLRAAGIDFWFTDCDGDIRPLAKLFLEGGINGMFPFEVNGSGHPGDFLREYGPAMRIMGGVDKMALGAGREAIKKHLESLAPWVERGGFIPFVDHLCPPNVKQEDYLYYLDLKEQMFGMKAGG